jgi:succinate dehydrogenase / fumarate reductase flavoprotein subunit
VSGGIDVFMECTIMRLLQDADGNVRGAFGYWRPSGEFIAFTAKAVVLATGGIGKAWKFTSNSWEYTGDGHAMALWAGADLIDMEFVQFHPTGMVWPPSVRGLLVTEGVRGDGGVLRNSIGDRFMFNYIPDLFRKETAETEEEADRWYTDKKTARRTPDLLPRDEVARAINSEVKAGRGSAHGGVLLDVATRLDAATIKRRLPSMYHQFLELADVDITKEPMEVGPTCHYVMGGVRVDADTAAATIPGVFAAGEVAAGLHGANRLGGNSLSDLVVFGKRAGEHAAQHAQGVTEEPTIDASQLDDLARDALAPFARVEGENPYTIHADLQDTMQTLVGIIRTESDLAKSIDEIQVLRDRVSSARVTGNRKFNPGWHLAMDLHAMLAVSECCARAALERRESRGGHTRDDYPDPDTEFAKVNIACRQDADRAVSIRREPLPEMPDDLREIIEEVAT